MNRKGFIFTMDAVLALIPVFIVMAGVSSLSYDSSTFLTVPMSRQAHDSLELLMQGTYPLAFGYVNTSNATNITNALDFSITYSYLLENSTNTSTTWSFVAGRCTTGITEGVVDAAKASADNVYTARRIYYYNGTRHNFRIFVWLE